MVVLLMVTGNPGWNFAHVPLIGNHLHAVYSYWQCMWYSRHLQQAGYFMEQLYAKFSDADSLVVGSVVTILGIAGKNRMAITQ